MGLTRCYKTTVFYIYISSFLLNLFYRYILLQIHIITSVPFCI